MTEDQWCILRMAGPRTLTVTASLVDAGFDVWTPTKAISKRRPRSNERREIIVPVLPSYAFARASSLEGLMMESLRQVSPHPPFSIFRYCNRIPLISDRALDNLRKIERRNLPEKAARMFKQGESVRITEGGFAGLTGIVKTGKGRFTMVLFPGFTMPIKVSSLLLMDEAESQPQEIAA